MRQEEPKVYPDKSARELGSYFLRHLSAMTTEGLHDKADIAVQLAWRDKEIDDLKRQLEDKKGQQ